LPLDFSKCLIFQCFLFLLQKWDKFLPLQNQRLMNLTPCDRLQTNGLQKGPLALPALFLFLHCPHTVSSLTS
jgi:hypothetical protein